MRGKILDDEIEIGESRRRLCALLHIHIERELHGERVRRTSEDPKIAPCRLTSFTHASIDVLFHLRGRRLGLLGEEVLDGWRRGRAALDVLEKCLLLHIANEGERGGDGRAEEDGAAE